MKDCREEWYDAEAKVAVTIVDVTRAAQELCRGHLAGPTAAHYLTEDWAVEGEAAWLEDSAGLAVDALGHFQGWDLYGDLFGYSRFDPFVTLGAKGWIGRDCGQVGPKAGLGAFYHLTDSWSLRADADATLGLETNCEMLYSLSVGVQYSF